ncbi:MAG: AsmA family protein [Alphaproteobacteria bacterium]|nr:AsmA family protein [Alphaproteobacteria bacterium]
MNKGLRIGLIGAAALGTALAAALAALPFVLPASAVKARIEQAVERAAGRKLAIDGPLRVTLYPALGLGADRVRLANASGGVAPDFATAEHLGIGLRLWPLLGGRIEATEIQLDRAVVHLEVDAAGRSNWLLRPAAHPGAARGSGSGSGSGGAPSAKGAQFSGIRIQDARVTYDNARTHTARSIDNLDAFVDLTDLDKPSRAKGSFALSGRTVAFVATVATPRAVLDEKPVGIDLTLAADPLNAHLAGRMSRAGTFEGRARFDAPSLTAAGALFGLRLPGGTVAFDGAVEARDDGARLHDFKLRLDRTTAAGSIALGRSDNHPVVTADLVANRLDIDSPSQPPDAHAPPHAANGNGNGNDPEAWSRAPLKLDVLRDIELHAHVEAASFSYRKIKAAKSSIRIDAAHGIAMVDLAQQMYGGTAKVGVTADLQRSQPAWSLDADFEHVALAPLLSDTIGVTQIEGTGAIKLDVTSQGANTEAVMRGLSGKGGIDFRNGRIKGVSFDKVARAVQAFLGAAIGQGAFTDFSVMSASFAAKDGVLTSNDFRLDGPLIKTSGAGDVDLGNRAIDFRIVPKASATFGKFKLVDIGVPFRIKGPWRHVNYAPDLSGIVKMILKPSSDWLKGDPKKKNRSVDDVLKKLLGIH